MATYWRTGNFNGGSFRAPANQATQETQRNNGWGGYGYEFYVPGRWGREGWNKWAFSGACLKSGPASPPVIGLATFYDPSDLSTLFQDAAGTTPVTADGDPVGLMRDKSGNGNHVSQSTAGMRPLWKSDGGLLFDGIDDCLVSASTITLTDASGQHSAGAAATFSTNTSIQNLLDADNVSAGPRLAQFIRNNAGTLEAIAFNSAVTPYTDTGPAITAGTGSVLTEITSTASVEAFVNGTGNGSTAIATPPLATVAAKLGIGAFNAGGSQFFGGRFYGSANYQGALSASDHALLVSYLAAKLPTGATYNDTLSETLTAADALTNAATLGSALAESLAAADSSSSAQVFVSSRSEALTAADSAASSATFPNAMSESLTSADSFVGGIVIALSLSEALASSDSLATVMTFASSISEAATAAAALATQMVFAPALSEGLTAADGSSTTATFVNAFGEGIAANDNSTPTATFPNGLSESATLATSFSAGSTTYNDSLAESATLSAASSAGLTAAPFLSEVASPDASVASALAFDLLLSEAVVGNDNVMPVASFAADLVETATLADAVDAVIGIHHPDVTTPSSRRAAGTESDRTAAGSLEDRSAVGNLQPRRSAA